MCFDAIDVRLERVPVELSVYRGMAVFDVLRSVSNGCLWN